MLLNFTCAAIMLLSLLGYAFFAKKQFGLTCELGLAISPLFCMLVLFLCGLFIRLTIPIYFLFFLGIILLVTMLWKKPRVRLDFWEYMAILFAVGVTALTVLFLSGRKFCFVDDFSHWAKIARSVVENQALPTRADPTIIFTTYPPGAALWISYFVSITGGSEDTYLIAQAMLIILLFCPVFSMGRNGKGERLGRVVYTLMFVGVIVSVITLSALTLGMSFVTLCVDGLLTACAVSTSFIILRYHGDIAKKALLAIPFLIGTILVKDAGILYTVMNVALFYLVERSVSAAESKKRIIRWVLLLLAVVAVVEAAWQIRVRFMFDHIENAPHSLSIARYMGTLLSVKDAVVEIVIAYTDKLLQKRWIICFVGLLLAFTALYSYKEAPGASRMLNARKAAAYLLVHYAVFIVGLLLVYLFSMDEESARIISSFDRYISIEHVYLYSICLLYMLHYLINADRLNACNALAKWVSGWKRKLGFACVTVVLLGMVFSYSAAFGGFINYDTSLRASIQKLNPEHYTGDLMVYAPSRMDGYGKEYEIMSLCVYDFRSIDMDFADAHDLTGIEIFGRSRTASLAEQINRHTHILIYEIDQRLLDYFRSANIPPIYEPGLYRIENGVID